MHVQKGTSLFQAPYFKGAPPLNNVGPVFPDEVPERKVQAEEKKHSGAEEFMANIV